MTTYSRRAFIKYSAILPSTILATDFQVVRARGSSHPFFARGKNRHTNSTFRCMPWTVNDLEGMQRMIALNVDGIITDFPGPLLALLGRSR
jgi:glycerophosphoryl diester phosphodiesterase